MFFRQTVNKIIHNDVGHPDVFAGSMIKVIPADRKPVTVSTEKEDVQIRARQADTRSERDSTPMDKMRAVRINKVREAR